MLSRSINIFRTNSLGTLIRMQPFCAETLSNNVVHDSKKMVFVLPVEGHQAEIVYSKKGPVIVLEHTEVPEALNGRGVGKILAKVRDICHIIQFNSVEMKFTLLSGDYCY